MLSLHCKLYVRLWMHMLYAGDYICVFVSGPRDMSTHNSK